MSAYNVLITSVECLNCHQSFEGKLQFKYGDTWQHVYRLNDAIKWGGNDIGELSSAIVYVYSILDGNTCPICGNSTDVSNEYDIIVQDNNIRSIRPMESIELYNSTPNGNYYIN